MESKHWYFYKGVLDFIICVRIGYQYISLESWFTLKFGDLYVTNVMFMYVCLPAFVSVYVVLCVCVRVCVEAVRPADLPYKWPCQISLEI
jgi:membrane-anchored protein YejM (alkaline phosphatase superfamily)